MSEYICQCGCSQPIPPKPHHKYRPPKYILAHYLRMKNTLRIKNAQKAHFKRRIKPPKDWKIPSGFCECGCGKPTSIAKVTRQERDQYIGYPLRYLSGHNRKNRQRGPNHPTWKGGRWKNIRGYVYIYAPEHPHSDHDDYIVEHRLVYEQFHNVNLGPTDVIHHVNGIRDDNRPENLVRTTRSGHARIHKALGHWREKNPEQASRHAKKAGLEGSNARWHKSH